MKYRLMAAVPTDADHKIAQRRVDQLLDPLGTPFIRTRVTDDTLWLPVADLLADGFRWPDMAAPTAWLDDDGLNWLFCRGGDKLPDELGWRLNATLQLPRLGPHGPRDNWLAVPVDAVAAGPVARLGGPPVVTGDWLLREAGHDRPCTNDGHRWDEAYETLAKRPWYSVSRSVAEQLVGWQCRERRLLMQELLDRGIAAAAAQRRVESQLAELRWEGNTLVYDASLLYGPGDASAVEKVSPVDGAYELPDVWPWTVVDRELVDVIHAGH